MTSFATSFGHTIPVVPGYRDRHLLVDAKFVFGEPDAMPSTFGLDGFVKDVYQYALMIDFLTDAGHPVAWRRALDLGGAEGTISRLLRGEGRAAWTSTVEARDFRPALSTAGFLGYFTRFRLATMAARVSRRMRRVLVEGASWRGRRLSNYHADFGWTPPRESVFWKLRLRNVPRIDDYVVGDFFALTGRYDLVTAFSCIAWFDVDRLFRAVSERLEDGGTFFFLADYWWFPVNSTFVVGEFPYACQRLTPSDFSRYLDEFHADERDDMMARSRYFHGGGACPTLDDYVASARRAGLELVATRRLVPPRLDGSSRFPTPRFFSDADEVAIDAALADIREFRSDVTAADLATSWVMAAFVKRRR